MTPSLDAAREAAIAARARHIENIAALDRGREQLAAAQAALDKLNTEDEAAVARHAKRLEARARKGETGPPPALVPTNQHVAAEVTARRTFAATRAMVDSLEAAARQSAEALDAAEAALAHAALSALSEEADARARDLEALRAQVDQEERMLRGVLDIPNFTPSRTVYRALRDTVNLPINELNPTGDWDRAWHQPIDQRNTPPVDAITFWRDRLTALIDSPSDASEVAA